jgi:hypothetical protein
MLDKSDGESAFSIAINDLLYARKDGVVLTTSYTAVLPLYLDRNPLISSISVTSNTTVTTKQELYRRMLHNTAPEAARMIKGGVLPERRQRTEMSCLQGKERQMSTIEHHRIMLSLQREWKAVQNSSP